MTKCPREPNKSCTYCPARPGEECPLDDRPAWMDEKPITAGVTHGVCAVDGEECESCQ